MTIIEPFSHSRVLWMGSERDHSNALLHMNEPKTQNRSAVGGRSLPFTGLPKTLEVLSGFARLFQRERCGLRPVAWRNRTLTGSLRGRNHRGWRLCRHGLLHREKGKGSESNERQRLHFKHVTVPRPSSDFSQSPVGTKRKRSGSRNPTSKYSSTF